MKILFLAAMAHSITDASYLDALAIARSIEQSSAGIAVCQIRPDSPTIACIVDGSPRTASVLVNREIDKISTQAVDVEGGKVSVSTKQTKFTMTLAIPDSQEERVQYTYEGKRPCGLVSPLHYFFGLLFS